MRDTTFNIDDPPDSSRPRNPWPRLLAFGLVVLLGMVLFGACLVAYSRSAPPRELEVSETALEVGLPRLLPATPFGADRFGFTYGAWVVRTQDGQTHALLSRDPGSGCHVQWNPTDGGGGVFVDPCDGSRYDRTGAHLEGPSPRGLDRFPFELVRGEVHVNVEDVTLGLCAEGQTAECSMPGKPETRSLPSGPLR